MSKDKVSFVFIAVFLLLLFTVDVFSQQWMTVKADSRFNFSGMALVENKDKKITLIVVHDNKDQFADKEKDPIKNKTERIGLVTIEGKDVRPTFVSLKWIDKDGNEKKLPVDLEAITSIPDMPNHFLTMNGNPFEAEEKGKAYLIKLDVQKKEVRVINTLKLPVSYDGRDFEGLAVQKLGNTLLAVWADRGANEKPATLFWGKLDLNALSIKFWGQEEIKTPFPDREDYKDVQGVTRSVSEVKIDSSGGVFISSVFDSTDEGPFASALYFAGVFVVQNDSVKLIKSANPIKLYQFNNYKVEAFEFLTGKNGGVVFGTDDEAFGASLYVN